MKNETLLKHEGEKRIRLHNSDGLETTIWESDLDKKLAEGWIKGGKPGRMTEKQKKALHDGHGPITDEYRQNQSEIMKNFFKNNPNWKTASKHAVVVEDPNSDEKLEFQSYLEMCRYMELPDRLAKTGEVGQWVKLGYIKRLSSKYNGWKIYRKN